MAAATTTDSKISKKNRGKPKDLGNELAAIERESWLKRALFEFRTRSGGLFEL